MSRGEIKSKWASGHLWKATAGRQKTCRVWGGEKWILIN